MVIQVGRAGNLAPEIEFTVRDIERQLNALERKLAPTGTEFPDELRADDKFYRTDRNIEYFYDGTRWLSTQLFTLEITAQPALFPVTATTTFRAPNPWAGVYELYVESGSLNALVSTVTSTTYFTCVIRYEPGGNPAVALTSNLSTQNITVNAWSTISDDVGTVVPTTADAFQMLCTETDICSAFLLGSIVYRLVG